jgi:HEAT repeat protein
MPAGAESDDSWSNSVSDWESAIADAPRELASALGNRQFPGQPDGFHAAIYALFGLVAFLIALIGAVLIAGQLRPLIHPKQSPLALKIRQSLHELESATSDEGRSEAARKIVRLGPDAVIAALDRPASEPVMVHALAEVRPKLVDALVDALRQALASPSANVRAAAANVLGELGARGKGAKEALIDKLADKNDRVRWYAVEALGNMGPEAASAVPALIPFLEHSDPLTRRRAIVALGQIGPSAKQAAPALTKAQDHDPDEAVRKAAHDALYQVHLVETAEKRRVETISQVRELIDKLRSGDEDAAVGAANTLSESDLIASDAIPELALTLQNKSRTPRIREAAAKTLGSFGSQARDVLPALQAAAHEIEPGVRAAARKALDQIEGK